MPVKAAVVMLAAVSTFAVTAPLADTAAAEIEVAVRAPELMPLVVRLVMLAAPAVRPAPNRLVAVTVPVVTAVELRLALVTVPLTETPTDDTLPNVAATALTELAVNTFTLRLPLTVAPAALTTPMPTSL